MEEINQKFHGWLDNILSRDMPIVIQGFNVNLYEGRNAFDSELIGAPTFDEEDEDWACDCIFTSERFEFPHEIVSNNWETALEQIAGSMKDYLASSSNGARTLKAAKGVGIGFVDGNLKLLFRNGRQSY